MHERRQTATIGPMASSRDIAIPNELVRSVVPEGRRLGLVVGIAVIHWLLRYVSTRSYAPFVAYRIVLGSVVLILLGTGAITADIAING